MVSSNREESSRSSRGPCSCDPFLPKYAKSYRDHGWLICADCNKLLGMSNLSAARVSRPATPGPSVDASTNALATDLAAS